MSQSSQRELQESCLRTTVEGRHESRHLTSAEIDHAVKVGMKTLDSGTSLTTWGQLADAGLAAVQTNRENGK